jgi:ubiquinone/menaquinone biosynthesis C-methylase UbiE
VIHEPATDRGQLASDRDRILAENLRLHRDLAAEYDHIHPHMRNSYEQRLQRRDVDVMLKAVSGGAGRVLELGCGTGNLTVQFLGRGCHVTAVDLSAEMLAELQRKVSQMGASERCVLRQSDVDAFLETDDGQRFDVIAMSSVLHHLPDYFASLTGLARRLRSGGFIYVIHEPAHHDELAGSVLVLRRLWSIVPRALDRILRDLKRNRAAAAQHWAQQDTSFVDYHYHRGGISVAGLSATLAPHDLRLVESSRYNAHETSLASWLDNFCFPVLRYEQFQRTYFRALWRRTL